LEVEVEDVSAGGEDVEALLARLVPPLAQLVPVRHRRHRVRLALDRHALAAVDVGGEAADAEAARRRRDLDDLEGVLVLLLPVPLPLPLPLCAPSSSSSPRPSLSEQRPWPATSSAA